MVAANGNGSGSRAAPPTGRGVPGSWFATGLFLLAAAIAVNSLLGPLAFGVLRYHVSANMENQLVGADVTGLAIVAPLAVVAGLLALRRHPGALLLGLAPALYAVYTYAQAILGAEHLALPGNSELFFPLHLGLFVVGGALAVRAGSGIGALGLPATSRRLERAVAGGLLAVAAFLVVGLHLPGLADALSGSPSRVEYVENPSVFWVVKLMDLGIVVPAAIVVGLALLRGRAWARPAMYVNVGWFTLVGISVAAMAVVMQLRGDPDASPLFVGAFGLFALAFAAFATYLYLPLLRRRETGGVTRQVIKAAVRPRREQLR